MFFLSHFEGQSYWHSFQVFVEPNGVSNQEKGYQWEGIGFCREKWWSNELFRSFAYDKSNQLELNWHWNMRSFNTNSTLTDQFFSLEIIVSKITAYLARQNRGHYWTSMMEAAVVPINYISNMAVSIKPAISTSRAVSASILDRPGDAMVPASHGLKYPTR